MMNMRYKKFTHNSSSILATCLFCLITAYCFASNHQNMVGRLNPEQSKPASEALSVQSKISESIPLGKEQTMHNAENKRQNILIFATFISMTIFILAFWQVHRTNIKLKKNQRELKEANDAKDKFFSIIAHDLRNPFQTLCSFIKLMERHATTYTPEEISELVTQLKINVNNTASLLENLLEWSQTQTNTLPFNPYMINLTPLIDKVMRHSYEIAQKKGLFLVNSIEDPIILYADRNMIEAIIRNMINNSIKFSRENGEIRIHAIYVNSHVEISISDNGVGIHPAIIKKLFQVGERVSVRGTENEPGTGLGLILCKEFVDLHKGEIQVESNVDEGTIFTIKLPGRG